MSKGRANLRISIRTEEARPCESGERLTFTFGGAANGGKGPSCVGGRPSHPKSDALHKRRRDLSGKKTFLLQPFFYQRNGEGRGKIVTTSGEQRRIIRLYKVARAIISSHVNKGKALFDGGGTPLII